MDLPMDPLRSPKVDKLYNSLLRFHSNERILTGDALTILTSLLETM